MPSRRLLIALAATFVAPFLASCRRTPEAVTAHPATTATSSSSSSPQPASVAKEDWEHESLPARDSYAGSASCKECHAKNFDRWSHDWHARALAEASGKSVAGDFQHAHYRGGSSEAWMSKKGDQFVMRTRGRDGQLADYQISYVIGGKRMQDTLTMFADGRWQVLPVYFHVSTGGEQPHRWVDYNEFKQGLVSPDHPHFWTNFKRTANKECLECHSTGLDLHYDGTSHKWSTSFIDAGVACEACHGPGARHAETKAKDDIVRPDHIDKELALSICARCHGPREPTFPLLDAKDQFRPGQSYGDHFSPLVVVDSTERSGEFFADGRPSSSSFEYQALLQSRCYRVGGATCLTCHGAPHDDHEGVDELKQRDPNSSCMQCHANVVAAGRAHTHHARATCVDCHMPKLLSGVLDKFADHTLDIPNPANTSKHAVPNACGLCHAKKSAESLQQTMSSWWPETAKRQSRRIRLADAIDEKTALASEPALAALVRDPAEAPTLRGAAASLLGQRFPNDAAGVLMPLLQERDPGLRQKVVEALGFAHATGAAAALVPLTNDPAIGVREMAALVLASFGDSRGTDALRKLASDPATRALVRPHIMLGVGAANRGDFDRAQSELELAVSEVPYATDALVFLADIAVRRGDRPRARAYLEEALRFNPSQRNAVGRLRALDGH